MSLFAKIMVVVNFILAVAFLAAAGTLLGAAENYKEKWLGATSEWKDEKTKLEAQITDRDNKAREAADRYAQSQKAQASAEGQLKVLQDSNASLGEAHRQLRADLDRLTESQKDLQNQNSGLNKDLEKTRGDLASEMSARRELDAKNKAQADDIARLSQDKDTAEKSLSAAAAKSKSDSDRIDELSTQIARYRTQSGPLAGGKAMKPVQGVVQACDNKADIYVLSVGSKDNVEAGYEFTIYRGSEYVTTIVIDKVFPNYSSGMTKPGMKKRDVMAGDSASTHVGL
jgi:DNA repair exonuclease SbcCD ATPase subunit